MKKKKEKLADVTTCDYTQSIDMNSSAIITEGEPLADSSVMREMPATTGSSVSVRTAKAHLSGLLEQVANGQEIVITSDGVPKARLVPVSTKKRLPFLGTREHLATMPPWTGGISSEEIIREDRDSRG
jgi:prevent-host-death family protein